MKKIVLTIIAVFASSLLFSQYHYIPYMIEGKNPGELNKDVENPYPAQAAGWTTLWNGGATSAVAYTANANIPFTFNFNGSSVTQYKVSNAGIVTFDVAATEEPNTFSNITLPSALVPDNSVCVLGIKPINSGNYRSAILSKTFGAVGKRQHWIQFNFFGEANLTSGWSYWAVVLEEGSNNIYIVDMKTLCVTATGQICSGNVKLSAGIQIDGTTAVSIMGSPNLGAGYTATNIFDASDNSYYKFIPGPHPKDDMASKGVTTPNVVLIGNAPITISGIFMNQGADVVNNFDFAYQVNNDAPVIANVTASLGVYVSSTFDHPTKWTPAGVGMYKVTIWPVNVNGNPDVNTAEDKTELLIYVAEAITDRKVLHEVFTSSTCGPCKPGNDNTDGVVFPPREDKITVIKYQQDFPGTGDPYATAESIARRGFYGVTAIPNMQVDGGWNGNAQNYNLNLLDNFAAKPSFLIIESTHNQINKKFDVTVKITPLADFNNSNMRLFVAICETSTEKNKKSNGEVKFFHVMKKMLPNHNGTAVGPLEYNVDKSFSTLSYSFPGNYRLPSNGQPGTYINPITENSIENFANMQVVVFVQDVVTREVYQSAISTPLTVTGIDNPAFIKESFVIYPNPTKGNTTVEFTLENSHQVEVNLYNSLGQLVKVIDSKQFEAGLNTVDFGTSDLPKGVYFVKLTGNGFSNTQSVIVQ